MTKFKTALDLLGRHRPETWTARDDAAAELAVELARAEMREAAATEAEKSAHPNQSCGHPICTAERLAAARIRALSTKVAP